MFNRLRVLSILLALMGTIYGFGTNPQTASADSHDEDSYEVELVNRGGCCDTGEGKVEIENKCGCRCGREFTAQEVELKVDDLCEHATYTVYADGVNIRSFETDGDGDAKLEFEIESSGGTSRLTKAEYGDTSMDVSTEGMQTPVSIATGHVIEIRDVNGQVVLSSSPSSFTSVPAAPAVPLTPPVE